MYNTPFLLRCGLGPGRRRRLRVRLLVVINETSSSARAVISTSSCQAEHTVPRHIWKFVAACVFDISGIMSRLLFTLGLNGGRRVVPCRFFDLTLRF